MNFQDTLNSECPFVAQSCNEICDESLHMHNFCEVFYVTKGSMDVVIDSKRYLIPQDHIIFINSAVTHSLISSPCGESEFCRVGFLPETVFLCENGYIDKNSFYWFYGKSKNRFSVYSVPKESTAAKLILHICELYDKKENLWEMRLQSDVLLLCDFFRLKNPSEFSDNDTFTSEDCLSVRKMFEYIHKNSDREIPLEKILKKSENAPVLFERLCGLGTEQYRKRYFTENKININDIPCITPDVINCSEEPDFGANNATKPILPRHERLISVSCQNEITKHWAIHLFCKVIYVKRGGGILETRGSRIVLRAGSVVCINNGEKYRFRNFSSETDVLFFQFYRRALSLGSRECPYMSDFISIPLWERVDIPTANGENQALSDVFSSLYEMHNSSETLSIAYMRSHCLKLACALIDMHTKRENSGSRVQKIIDYVNSHYTHNLKLAQLGEQFGISYYHLSRRFKEITGKSFNAYINSKRIEHANYLIAHTDYSINKISDILGYCRRSHFTEQYTKMYGMTPSEYRENKGTVR